MFRYVARCNTLRKCFHDGRLADTRFTDKDRIIFPFSGQDPNDVSDLGISADDGINLAALCFFNQLQAVFFERVVSRFRIVAGYALIAAHGGQCRQEFVPVNSEFAEDLLHFFIRMFEQHQKQMLHRNVLVAECFCFVFRTDEYAV